VSGTSNRQTKALAASVRDKVKEAGGDVVGLEGEDTGEWVLVDLGDMVVHIMQPAIRDYYRLEEIWGENEIKLGAAKRAAKRTAEKTDGVEAPKKRASRHVAATQAADDDAPTKPVRKTAAKTATKTAAKKAATVPVGKTVKVAPAKSAAAARKAPAKRASAKKTAAG
jgi:ribosome-associated protein